MGYQKGKTPTHNLALKEWKWMNEMATNNTTVSWSCKNDEDKHKYKSSDFLPNNWNKRCWNPDLRHDA